MIAKLTSKNRITIPKAVLSSFEGAEQFDVAQENGRIVLVPVSPADPGEAVTGGSGEAILEKLANPEFDEQDFLDAAAWARSVDPAEADAIRENLDKLGVIDQDVSDAVEWARRG